MIRTNLYLGDKQHGELELIVEETGLPMAELIRRAIDLFVEDFRRKELAKRGTPKGEKKRS